jgi:hypothetical protein
VDCSDTALRLYKSKMEEQVDCPPAISCLETDVIFCPPCESERKFQKWNSRVKTNSIGQVV